MAESVKPIEGLAQPLVQWYTAHERAFPWREHPTPYRVWVSEIMLQQTRIEAALPYFERFMAALPTLRDLAEASEDTLLKLWEGLGYYSRVRNLQKAAQVVMRDYGGELPCRYEQLLTLPGIGEYTAGAIASIAFGKRAAAVDGNVLRVMARLTNDDRDVMQSRPRRELTELVRRLVPAEAPGAFNQGLMELGETICLPNAQPKCAICPVNAYCAVAGTQRARELPTRSAPKARRVEQRTVLVVVLQGAEPKVLLHRRAPRGLLGGMWELPNLLTDESVEDFLKSQGITAVETQPLSVGRHVFSHVEWQLSGLLVKAIPFIAGDEYVLVTAAQLSHYALPTAFRTYTAALPALLKKEEEVE